MDHALFGNLETDPSLPVFVPERLHDEMAYAALRCACGVEVFRLAGWPRIASGRGGFFWRTLARVWREARLPMKDGELIDSPFRLPIEARCQGCERDEMLFDDEKVADRLAVNRRGEPRESIRCRACRRGLFELVVGVAMEERLDSPFTAAVEIVTRCHSCHTLARIAWSGGQRSDQEIRLDLLYGRR